MKWLSALVLLCTFFLGCGTDTSTRRSASQTVDSCGDIRIGVQSQAIVGGTRAPEEVSLTAGQRLAIGRTPGCTATLISPMWAISAQHCQTQPGARFCFGHDPESADNCVEIEAVHHHEDYHERVRWDADLTLLRLETPATEIDPDVTPIPVQTESVTGWEGVRLESAGYGRSDTGTGTRYFVALPVERVYDPFITMDGTGTDSGICFGDSGGPLIGVANDGSVRVVGVHSHIWGEPECMAYSNHLRLDLYVDWIRARIEGAGDDATEALKPMERSCEGIGAEGLCEGNIAIYCEGGEQIQDSCDSGMACGWSDEAVGFRCLPEDTPDPCDGFDSFGACQDGVAYWCSQGTVRSRDCGACGMGCGLESWGADCI